MTGVAVAVWGRPHSAQGGGKWRLAAGDQQLPLLTTAAAAFSHCCWHPLPLHHHLVLQQCTPFDSSLLLLLHLALAMQHQHRVQHQQHLRVRLAPPPVQRCASAAAVDTPSPAGSAQAVPTALHTLAHTPPVPPGVWRGGAAVGAWWVD